MVKFVPEGPIDNKSALFQVMAWCLMAPSHYLKKYWPKSVVPLGHNEWALVMLNCFEKNTKLYLHFYYPPNTEMAQVLEILPGGSQGPVYPSLSIAWLLMAWRHRNQGIIISYDIDIVFPECSRPSTNKITLIYLITFLGMYIHAWETSVL